jgi:hypothetical protein
MPVHPITEGKSRDARLDALRGLFLVIMAAVHVPTPLSHLLQEPFGYTSAAEGFVFLGACLAGFVYGKTYLGADWAAMARRAWLRARQIYFVHLALVVPFALLAWAVGQRLAPLANHFHEFLEHPWASLTFTPLLLHQPPLFDILPLYVIFLGATPFVLASARRKGWGIVLLISGLGWLAAQFGLSAHLIAAPSGSIPLCLGQFNLLAWQFLWCGGLALGQTAIQEGKTFSPHSFSKPTARPQNPSVPWRRVLGAVAGAVVLVGLLSRHEVWPRAWFSPDLYLWMDKWTLGPLRLLNFAAWVGLLLCWKPSLPSLLSPLALLGRNALPVFAFHVPAAILASIVIQTCALSAPAQTGVGLLVIAALFAWAALHEAPARRRASQTALARSIAS